MTAKSVVYFLPVRESDGTEKVVEGLRRLIDSNRLFDFIRRPGDVPVKIHFGEKGNTGHVKPEYAGAICGAISRRGATPILTDTNTLYKGLRSNSNDHAALAREHGFTKAKAAAEVVIPDDSRNENVTEIAVNGTYIDIAKIVTLFAGSGPLVGIAHFKGHLMTGFGGALKNIGMGCASREGKLAQHSDIAPIVNLLRCKGCLECIKSCPADAIYVTAGHQVTIDGSKCIGCSSCIASCENAAIDVNWESGGSDIQEKMIEYASAVLAPKKSAFLFFNFALKITQECDCLAGDDPRIAPDIGVFASHDPVAVDAACYDAVLNACGKDIFKEVHPSRDGTQQLVCAEKMGLGSRGYALETMQ